MLHINTFKIKVSGRSVLIRPHCLSSAVQLWVVGNYHWYLKQSLDFGADPQRAPVCVCWDPERPLRFHMVTRGWSTVTYDWGWTTERSPGLDATDGGGVAVIDGGESRPEERERFWVLGSGPPVFWIFPNARRVIFFFSFGTDPQIKSW